MPRKVNIKVRVYYGDEISLREIGEETRRLYGVNLRVFKETILYKERNEFCNLSAHWKLICYTFLQQLCRNTFRFLSKLQNYWVGSRKYFPRIIKCNDPSSWRWHWYNGLSDGPAWDWMWKTPYWDIRGKWASVWR